MLCTTGGALTFHNPRNPDRATTLSASIADSAFELNAAGQSPSWRGFSNTASQGRFTWIGSMSDVSAGDPS